MNLLANYLWIQLYILGIVVSVFIYRQRQENVQFYYKQNDLSARTWYDPFLYNITILNCAINIVLSEMVFWFSSTLRQAHTYTNVFWNIFFEYHKLLFYFNRIGLDRNIEYGEYMFYMDTDIPGESVTIWGFRSYDFIYLLLCQVERIVACNFVSSSPKISCWRQIIGWANNKHYHEQTSVFMTAICLLLFQCKSFFVT